MASSFIYRPHVETLDGVVTPDVLIDSLKIAAKGEAKHLPVPIDRLTTDNEIQVAGMGHVPDASLALIGAGAGMLLKSRKILKASRGELVCWGESATGIAKYRTLPSSRIRTHSPPPKYQGVRTS